MCPNAPGCQLGGPGTKGDVLCSGWPPSHLGSVVQGLAACGTLLSAAVSLGLLCGQWRVSAERGSTAQAAPGPGCPQHTWTGTLVGVPVGAEPCNAWSLAFRAGAGHTFGKPS